jgi:hypothetical protein
MELLTTVLLSQLDRVLTYLVRCDMIDGVATGPIVDELGGSTTSRKHPVGLTGDETVTRPNDDTRAGHPSSPTSAEKVATSTSPMAASHFERRV